MKNLRNVQMILWPCSVEIYEDWSNNLEIIIKEFKFQSEKIYNWLISWKIWLRWWCWKPRTQPWWFEWFWERAVDIMSEIQEKYWIICITEIWTVKHFEYCLKKWLRRFWIWARSSSSPFFMNELIEFIKEHKEYNQSEIIIWVKNTIWFDIDLWIWNMKRLSNFWFTVFPIHRWVSYDKSLFDKSLYSNNWKDLRNIPIHFSNSKEILEKYKNFNNNFDVFFDDFSHQLWDRGLILELLEDIKKEWIKIFDENLEPWTKKEVYVMLEIHQDPKNALTDSKQQLTIWDIVNFINK